MKRFLANTPARLLIYIVALLLASCDVHYWPDEEPPVPVDDGRIDVEVDLSLTLGMKLLMNVDYETRAAQAWGTRYQLAVFGAEAFRSRATGSPLKPDTLVTLLEPTTTLPPSKTFHIRLRPGAYHFAMWVDHTPKGSTADYYYDTSDWAAIRYLHQDNYIGSTQTKETVRGTADYTIHEGFNHVVMNLTRPQAEFCFIATDLREFLRTHAGLSRYTARLHYTAFLPAEYNFFTDAPSDSWRGISFPSSIKAMNQDEALMAFDLVMVNHAATSVKAAIELVAADGSSLGWSPPIDVPLQRGHYTEVRGHFLTTSVGGGVGINADFDGQYNIHIQ